MRWEGLRVGLALCIVCAVGFATAPAHAASYAKVVPPSDPYLPGDHTLTVGWVIGYGAPPMDLSVTLAPDAKSGSVHDRNAFLLTGEGCTATALLQSAVCEAPALTVSLQGGEFDDRLVGRGGQAVGDMTVAGAQGNDVIDLRGSAGHAFLGAGNDRIDARGGLYNWISCEGGHDVVRADAADHIDSDCESVTLG